MEVGGYLDGRLHHSSLLSGKLLFTEMMSLRYWLKAWSRNISSLFKFSSIDIFSRIAPLPISPGPSLPKGQRTNEQIFGSPATNSSMAYCCWYLFIRCTPVIPSSYWLCSLTWFEHEYNYGQNEEKVDQFLPLPGTMDSLVAPLSLPPARQNEEQLFSVE